MLFAPAKDTAAASLANAPKNTLLKVANKAVVLDAAELAVVAAVVAVVA